MRETIKETIRRIPYRAKTVFGAHPRRYWSGVLVFFVGLLVVMLIFDAFLYFGTQRSATLTERDLSASLQGIDQEQLSFVIETIQSRQETFQKILQSPPVADPSVE